MAGYFVISPITELYALASRRQVATIETHLLMAIWFPFGMGATNQFASNQASQFDFFQVSPDYVDHGGMPVFYHGSWSEKSRHLFDTRRLSILRSWHPKLGSIHAIETGGLDYRFTMASGPIQKVEAEEMPGLVYGLAEPITDWRIHVELEPASSTRTGSLDAHPVWCLPRWREGRAALDDEPISLPRANPHELRVPNR